MSALQKYKNQTRELQRKVEKLKEEIDILETLSRRERAMTHEVLTLVTAPPERKAELLSVFEKRNPGLLAWHAHGRDLDDALDHAVHYVCASCQAKKTGH